MRLTRIDLKNFGCYEARTFDFTERTYIVGITGAGKTTILDAVRWVLTGRCDGLDRAGRGLGTLMRQGAGEHDSMVVTLHATIGQFAYTIQRAYTRGNMTFQVDGGEVDATLAADEQYGVLLSRLGVSKDVLEVVLDPRVFLAADHVAAKDILLAILKPMVAVDAETSITLAECDRRYEKAYEERTGLNRGIKMLPMAVQPSEAVGDTDALARKIAEIKAERDTKATQRAETGGQSDTLRAEGQRLTKEGKDLDARLDRLTLDWTDEEAADAVGIRAAVLQERNEKGQRMLELDLALMQPAYEASDVLEKIHKHEPSKGCVLNAEIECKTSQTQFVRFYKKAKDTATGVVVPGDPRHAELATLKTELAGLNLRLDRLSQADLVVELLARQTVILNRVHEIDETLASAPDTSTLDTEIAALDERIQTGHDRVAKKARLAAEWKTFEAHKAAREKAQADILKAEADVKLYGPKGARVQALDASLSKFHAVVNAHLKTFGFTLEVAVDPWAILVNGRTRLSTSERLRVTVALAAAFAEMTEIDVVLVDSIDWLLKEQRGQLTQTMAAYPQAQWIGCKAHEPGEPFAPKIGSVIRL